MINNALGSFRASQQDVQMVRVWSATYIEAAEGCLSAVHLHGAR